VKEEVAVSPTLNFYAGPAILPKPVLERARDEMLNWASTGTSVLETSHRSKEYDAVHHEAMSLVKELLGLGDDYTVLFLGGGASTQFAMVPMNFMPAGSSADYVVTGSWAKKALKEAQIIGTPKVAASAEGDKFTRIPRQEELKLDPNATYVHITTNNTIYGCQWHYVPDTGSVPLVADMSSDFLWAPFDARKFSLVYAGAQKNVGPAGVTVVVVKKAWVDKAYDKLPTMLKYATHAKEDSLYNTPPVFAIYIVRWVLQWVKDNGGLAAMGERNRAKGDRLYGVIDAHPGFYRCPVEKGSRSYMNVVYRLPSEELEERFVKEAKAAGMVGLKGHRSVGGCRASIYNAMDFAGVDTLALFMEEFARKNG
jgi:phosphoserine aminotransferase